MKRMLHGLHEAAGCVLRVLLRLLVWAAFRPVRCYASEQARRTALQGPCVIISNHVRGMDGAVIQALLPGRRVYSMAAKDLMDQSPALRHFLSFCRVVPVDRQHVSLSWLREGRRLLKAGNDIYLCPEGRCNRKRVVQPFKSGFVTLAASACVPVVPIYHNGEYHYICGKRFRMMIGEPISITPPPEGLSEDEMQRETEVAQSIMRSLEAQLNGSVRE